MSTGLMPQSLPTVYKSNLQNASTTKRYLTQIAEGQGNAIYQVADQLDEKYASTNTPYPRALATRIYDIPNIDQTGLGDGSNPSLWESVATTFATQIGSGLSARIGGANRPESSPDLLRLAQELQSRPPTPIPTPNANTLPTWAKVAMAGVGVLGLLYIVKRA